MAKQRPQPVTGDEYLAQMERDLRTLAYRHTLWTVFQDFVALGAISLSNAVDRRQFETREAEYMRIVQRYTKEEVNVFPQIFSHLVLALEDDPQDHLGRLYHRLELQQEQRGQFFTPWHICYCMAQMSIHDAQAQLETQEFITALEPCVGSGTMILALAQALRDQDINYQQRLHVTAIDCDITCVYMAYIQLTLLHIPAIVYHGDTLRGETWSTWYTPAHILGGWSWKLARREREEQVVAALAPPVEDAVVVETPVAVAVEAEVTEVPRPTAAVEEAALAFFALADPQTPPTRPEARKSARQKPTVTVGSQLTLW